MHRAKGGLKALTVMAEGIVEILEVFKLRAERTQDPPKMADISALTEKLTPPLDEMQAIQGKLGLLVEQIIYHKQRGSWPSEKKIPQCKEVISAQRNSNTKGNFFF